MIDFNNRHLFTPFTHPESGITFHILTRKVAPVQQGFYFVNDSMSADGRYLWFYCAFPRHCWHSHSSRDGRLIVGDSNNGFFRGCASTVHFMNRDTGKVIVLAEHAECTDYAGRNYHIDPHPRFCCNDQYVVFTTTVRGEVDVAIVPTADLVRASTD